MPAPKSPGFAAEFKDAVTFRAFGLVLGGLLVQLAFIVSYVGAFHSPPPSGSPWPWWHLSRRPRRSSPS